jgi:hypothetical protein
MHISILTSRFICSTSFRLPVGLHKHMKNTLHVRYSLSDHENVMFEKPRRQEGLDFLCNKSNQILQFHKFILAWNSTCFGQFLCPSSAVYSMYTQQWFMSYKFVDSFRAFHPGPAVYKPVWHIPLLSVQWIISWWWTEELSETCRVSCQNNLWN